MRQKYKMQNNMNFAIIVTYDVFFESPTKRAI